MQQLHRGLEGQYPVTRICSTFGLSRSSWYHRSKRKAKVITQEEFRLHRRIKELFNSSRGSLGSRQLVKKLALEGIIISRSKVRKIMKTHGLKVIQRTAYKVTTKRKHSDSVADNLVNMKFDPKLANTVWAGDVTYLRTREGWCYLAIVMDLHSRKVIGWCINKHMTAELVIKAMQMAINLRQPQGDLIFHSDRGSQYTGKRFRKLLKKNGIKASMSGKGACWDNAVVERFFGSLKNEWLLKVIHLTRESMKIDVHKYICYYNHERLHTTLGDLTPVAYEKRNLKVSNFS
jgi:putative transposase